MPPAWIIAKGELEFKQRMGRIYRKVLSISIFVSEIANDSSNVSHSVMNRMTMASHDDPESTLGDSGSEERQRSDGDPAHRTLVGRALRVREQLAAARLVVEQRERGEDR